MIEIANDAVFKAELQKLDDDAQRLVGARFVSNVLDLADDDRVGRVIEVASEPDSTADQLEAAYKTARTTSTDSYTRCGADGDWKAQAGYFVAKAAASCLTPADKCKPGGPAWQAATAARMARTSALIDSGEDAASESKQQYIILADFLSF